MKDCYPTPHTYIHTYIYIYIYIYIYTHTHTHTRKLGEKSIQNGIEDPSSNLGLGCSHFYFMLMLTRKA